MRSKWLSYFGIFRRMFLHTACRSKLQWADWDPAAGFPACDATRAGPDRQQQPHVGTQNPQPLQVSRTTQICLFNKIYVSCEIESTAAVTLDCYDTVVWKYNNAEKAATFQKTDTTSQKTSKHNNETTKPKIWWHFTKHVTVHNIVLLPVLLKGFLKCCEYLQLNFLLFQSHHHPEIRPEIHRDIWRLTEFFDSMEPRLLWNEWPAEQVCTASAFLCLLFFVVDHELLNSVYPTCHSQVNLLTRECEKIF